MSRRGNGILRRPLGPLPVQSAAPQLHLYMQCEEVRKILQAGKPLVHGLLGGIAQRNQFPGRILGRRQGRVRIRVDDRQHFSAANPSNGQALTFYRDHSVFFVEEFSALRLHAIGMHIFAQTIPCKFQCTPLTIVPSARSATVVIPTCTQE